MRARHVIEQPRRLRSLWTLPLFAGLLPAIGTVIALSVSIRLGLVESCNPLATGCMSISRAARHDLANHLFRALVLPGAVLQWLTWMLCRDWLISLGAAPRLRVLLLPWLGAVAAIFLVLYGTFLGTDGSTYRWLRFYGTIGYFSGSYLCLLIAAGEIRQLARGGSASLRAWHLDRLLPGACALLLLLGLVNATVAPYFDNDLKNRIENACEWWLGIGITLCFLGLSLLWKRARSSLEISTSASG